MPDAPALKSDRHLPVAVTNHGLPQTFEETQELSEAISRALRRAARNARAPAPIIRGGAGFRARKGDREFRLGVISSFIVLFILPLIAASLYWGLIASEQYSTEMKFAVRAGEGSPLDSLGGMFGLGASQQAQDTQIVADYIRSRAMVEALGKNLDLRKIYSSDNVDYFSRFDRTDSIEDLEKYWRKRVDTKIETLSGIVSVDVRAFTPNDSLALGSRILELSESLVNDMSTRSRRDALTQAQKELSRAEERLQSATAAMRDARDTEGVLDAGAAGEALNKVVATLRLELSHLEQDVASQGGGVRDSPQIRVLQSRIASVRAQIADYSGQVAGLDARGSNGSMADRMGLLSQKQMELDLARQQYAQWSAIYENARVDLETQHAYLVTSLRPTLAQKSTYPRRWWEWSIVVFPCLLGWAILAAIAFLVRDNMAK
jgi:capsular polysaccharide transport system permease protein